MGADQSRQQQHQPGKKAKLEPSQSRSSLSHDERFFALAEEGNSDGLVSMLPLVTSVDWRGEKGRTPLLAAARHGRGACVDVLLAAKADPSLANANEVTPLMVAASGGHERIVEMLLIAGAPFDKADETGRTAAEWARLAGHTRLALLLEGSGTTTSTRHSQQNETTKGSSYQSGQRMAALDVTRL